MTLGELILLKSFRAAQRFADVPAEIIKMIIEYMNLRSFKGRIAYNRRRNMPRYYNPLAFLPQTPEDARVRRRDRRFEENLGLTYEPFYGPGF